MICLRYYWWAFTVRARMRRTSEHCWWWDRSCSILNEAYQVYVDHGIKFSFYFPVVIGSLKAESTSSASITELILIKRVVFLTFWLWVMTMPPILVPSIYTNNCRPSWTRWKTGYTLMATWAAIHNYKNYERDFICTILEYCSYLFEAVFVNLHCIGWKLTLI